MPGMLQLKLVTDRPSPTLVLSTCGLLAWFLSSKVSCMSPIWQLPTVYQNVPEMVEHNKLTAKKCNSNIGAVKLRDSSCLTCFS